MTTTHRNGLARTMRRGAIPIAAMTVVLATACGSNTPSSSPATTAGTGTSGTVATGATSRTGTSGSTPGTALGIPASSTCVADPAKVISTQQSPTSITGTLPADLVGKLDAAAQSSFKEAAAPGAIVGVRTPQGTWIQAYGEADPEKGTAMTADMHTRVGSVTKTFTGTMVMQLAQQGKLSLDDPIDKYVPGVPNGDRITLRLLANMTSGVASYTASTKFTDTYFAKPETVFKPDELLAVGLADSPIFEPGEKFNYSNTNTILLGKVIEKVTGQDVGDVFEELILQPLKLTNTSWPGESTEMPAPFAQGYTLQGDTATPDNPSNATHWNPAWGWTAGEMISNMQDLLTYDRALGTGQGLLDPASQTERLTSFPGAGGYGIALGCIDGWVGHTGELPGYNTTLYYHAASDTSVVVQVNSDISSGNCSDSPTLTDDPRNEVCSSPATRMFAAISTATGNTFTPLPAK